MRITIGLPFWNCEATLADAIRSVFAQTHQDWELILLDDGSTDGSLEIARAVRDERVAVHRNTVNRGLSAGLNQIVRLARGEYIARMDADDLMHPERLARQLHHLETHPDVAAVGTAVLSIDDRCRPRGMRGTSGIVNAGARSVLENGLLTHATVLGRTAWFRRNPYNEFFRRAEDREFWCRTFRDSKVAQLSQPLYFVREHGTASLSKYLLSGSETRHIVRRYAPALVGRRGTAALMLRSYLKSAAYLIFSTVHLRDLLVNCRNTPLPEEARSEAVEVIERIRRTKVPGLADRGRQVPERMAS